MGTGDGDLEGDDIFILGANLLKDFSCYLATGIGSASGFTFTIVILISFVIAPRKRESPQLYLVRYK